MSQELTNARRALSKVSSDVKQGQLISAATAIRDASRLFGRVPMMKNEHEELTEMLTTAADYLHYNEEITKAFPLQIKYVPGQEESFADLMNQLIETLQDESTRQAVAKHAEYKAGQLAKGHKELKNGQFDEGRRTLDKLGMDYSTDWELAAEIGELFTAAGLFEDALRHLSLAVRLNPASAHVLNRLGIVLRKLKRYADSEKYFDKAMAIEQADPNLFFNCARLYFDWDKWDRAVEYAKKALALDPSFSEAAKLVAYVERKTKQS